VRGAQLVSPLTVVILTTIVSAAGCASNKLVVRDRDGSVLEVQKDAAGATTVKVTPHENSGAARAVPSRSSTNTALSNIQPSVREVDCETTRLRNERDHLRSEITQVTMEQAAALEASKKANAARQVAGKMEQEVQRLSLKKAELEDSVAACRAEDDNARAQLGSTTAAMAERQQQLVTLNRQLGEIHAAIANSQAELERVEENVKGAEAKASEDLTELERQIADRKHVLANLSMLLPANETRRGTTEEALPIQDIELFVNPPDVSNVLPSSDSMNAVGVGNVVGDPGDTVPYATQDAAIQGTADHHRVQVPNGGSWTGMEAALGLVIAIAITVATVIVVNVATTSASTTCRSSWERDDPTNGGRVTFEIDLGANSHAVLSPNVGLETTPHTTSAVYAYPQVGMHRRRPRLVELGGRDPRINGVPAMRGQPLKVTDVVTYGDESGKTDIAFKLVGLAPVEDAAEDEKNCPNIENNQGALAC
jgi:peptidoglycan hydrolase CwlO-like protein